MSIKPNTKRGTQTIPPSMRSYYVDLGYKDVRTGMYDAFQFDDEGIPQYPYGSRSYYNITFICHYALYQLSLHQKYGRADGLERFMHVSEWIARNGEEQADSFTFPYRFGVGELEPPWLSALGQGRIISVLTRAADGSGDGRFLDLARKALRPFEIPVEEGGVRRDFEDGGIAFEEYPKPYRNLVLNGLITALFGIYDLSTTGDKRAEELFDAGTTALDRNLHHYDLGYWSAYDLSGPIRRVAGDEYHEYHIMLLWALYEMTGNESFKRTAARWGRYRKSARLHFFRTLSRVHTRLRHRKS